MVPEPCKYDSQYMKKNYHILPPRSWSKFLFDEAAALSQCITVQIVNLIHSNADAVSSVESVPLNAHSVWELFPRIAQAAPCRLWEACIHDGREILSVAQLVEAKEVLVADALDYATNMTEFRRVQEVLHAARTESGAHVRRRFLPDLLRALFMKHAHVHGIRLADAVKRWLPKLRELYGEYAIVHVHELLEVAEWEWE